MFEEARWFAHKGIPHQYNIVKTVPIGPAKLLVFQASSPEFTDTYAVPLINGSPSDGSAEYLNFIAHCMMGQKSAGNEKLEFKSMGELGTIHSTEEMAVNSSNILFRTDMYLSKSYRRLRRWNREPEVLAHLHDRGYKSAPACHGYAKYDGFFFHAFIEYRDAQEAGELYAGNARATVSGEASPLDASNLGCQVLELHRALSDYPTGDALDGDMWLKAVDKRNGSRLSLIRAVLGEKYHTLAEDALASVHGGMSAGTPQMTHGDLHLGQIIYSHGTYCFLDFEGEPDYDGLPVFPPERDVASLVRSLDYTARMTAPEDPKRAEQWYEETAGSLLDGYGTSWDDIVPWMVEKAVYEVVYELKNRPDMVNIPLAALMKLKEDFL